MFGNFYETGVMFNKYKLFSIYPRPRIFSRLKKTSSETKINNVDRAMNHFDDFYKPIFQKSWPSIRLGLLCGQKYIAAINNYSDVDRTRNFLETQGAINVRRLFEVELSKLSGRRKKIKSNTSDLGGTITEITKKKAEDEYNELYSNERILAKNSASVSSSIDETSDRYIDPSVSVSQLYEYVPATKLKGFEDWSFESEHYSYYKNDSDFEVNILQEKQLRMPTNLHFYTFEPGNVTPFPRPRKGETGVSDYFLMDGGSILPVLALDVGVGDVILDMCAAPGGKSYLCLQTLYPDSIVCNDSSNSRTKRIEKLMNEFFYDYDKKVSKGEILITEEDARFIDAPGRYNKILVDVPCTTDRHSVSENNNNLFKPTRIKERIKIPQLQSQILTTALKLVTVGGTVIYSTCSLSPIQNDGVVHMALQTISEQTDFEIAVVDMKEALEPTKILFQYSDVGLRYGHLVVPHLLNNFGPTYFCKLVKSMACKANIVKLSVVQEYKIAACKINMAVKGTTNQVDKFFGLAGISYLQKFTLPLSTGIEGLQRYLYILDS